MNDSPEKRTSSHAGLKYGFYEVCQAHAWALRTPPSSASPRCPSLPSHALAQAFKPEAAALLPAASPLFVLLAAALAAELIASVALCPLEAVRIRAVCNPAYD